MKMWLLAVLALAACGGESKSEFDAELGGFEDAYCDWQISCVGGSRLQCDNDVARLMEEARDRLSTADEAVCADCMHERSIALHALANAQCDDAQVDMTSTYAACDLDPAVDFDGDGTPDNDVDEACAGLP